MTGGNLVTAATAVHCPHGGRIVAATAAASIRADGQTVRTTGETYAVLGCPNLSGPCRTVRFTPRAGGLLVDGVPALLDDTDGQCFSADLRPQGPPVFRGDSRGVRCR
ncbi:hypothetical protein [Saccharopolyspora gregorii]|uniref:DUF4280 domain-containing protein n=1 Tax=Saccharopolyspora gregorii TaxID=33914 RepID=A0ABP6RNK5_9PSEU|nr:hypothetical protein [Saccharopolyspora gregorii]